MTVTENGLHLVFEINGENEIKLLHFSALPFDERTLTSQDGTVGFRLAEVQISGLDRPGERHGLKYVRTAPGYRLKYQDFSDTRNELGRKLVITMADEPLSLIVRSHLQFYDGVQAVRSWTEVVNSGGAPRGLEYDRRRKGRPAPLRPKTCPVPAPQRLAEGAALEPLYSRRPGHVGFPARGNHAHLKIHQHLQHRQLVH